MSNQRCIECDRTAVARKRCRPHWDALRIAEGRSTDASCAWTAERRARQVNPDGRIERITKSGLAERDDATCGLCGDVVDLTLKFPDPFSQSTHYIVALSRGGEHVWDNVRLAHLRCNLRARALGRSAAESA